MATRSGDWASPGRGHRNLLDRMETESQGVVKDAWKASLQKLSLANDEHGSDCLTGLYSANQTVNCGG